MSTPGVLNGQSSPRRLSRRGALLTGAIASGAPVLAAACSVGVDDGKPAAERRPVTLQLLDPPFSDANAALMEQAQELRRNRG